MALRRAKAARYFFVLFLFYFLIRLHVNNNRGRAISEKNEQYTIRYDKPTRFEIRKFVLREIGPTLVFRRFRDETMNSLNIGACSAYSSRHVPTLCTRSTCDDAFSDFVRFVYDMRVVNENHRTRAYVNTTFFLYI